MDAEDEYVMLMASLPRIRSPFADVFTPISGFRLRERLGLLSAEDRQVLDALWGALDWRRLGASVPDAEIVRRAGAAAAILPGETLPLVLRDRMELRTTVAALRRRARGLGPPAGRAWGYGRWRDAIVRNWTVEDFGLSRSFPWAGRAARLVAGGDALGMERLLLEEADRLLRRRGARHEFDLEAVAIYVLRWSLAERWTGFNATAAARRFADLVETALDGLSLPEGIRLQSERAEGALS